MYLFQKLLCTDATVVTVAAASESYLNTYVLPKSLVARAFGVETEETEQDERCDRVLKEELAFFQENPKSLRLARAVALDVFCVLVGEGACECIFSIGSRVHRFQNMHFNS